jgi:type IV pilus assembly protein PilN
MIEINLLPGSTRRPARRGAPRLGGAGSFSKLKLPGVDRTAGLIALGWVIGLGAIAFLHLGMSSRMSELDVKLEAAVRDSARYATLRAQGDSLTAREGVIAQKLEVIQQIDAGRYTWPHILDEISRALPQYVWLDAVTQIGEEGHLPRIQIDGYAGTPFALTRFMEQLESSPFLGGTRLISTAQSRADNRTVHVFMLVVQYREPPPDALETVPLIGTEAQEN